MAPNNVTKLVNDHLRRDAAIREDLAVHGATLPARVARALGEPELEKALETAFAGAGRAQKRAATSVREADLAHLDEQTDDAGLRMKRDEAAAAVYQALTSSRGFVDTVFGREMVRQVGFVGDTPTDALSLSRLAPLVSAKLKKLPAPADGARAVIDFAGLAADIDHALTPLDEALRATQKDLRENETTLRARNEKIAASTLAQNFSLDLLRLCAAAVDDADLSRRLRVDFRVKATPEAEVAPETEVA